MIKQKSKAGQAFSHACDTANRTALKENELVEFKFNGVVCFVNNKTNLDYLDRDYGYSHLLMKDTIGPDCLKDYSPALKAKIKKLEEIQQLKEELRGKINSQLYGLNSIDLKKVTEFIQSI